MSKQGGHGGGGGYSGGPRGYGGGTFLVTETPDIDLYAGFYGEKPVKSSWIARLFGRHHAPAAGATGIHGDHSSSKSGSKGKSGSHSGHHHHHHHHQQQQQGGGDSGGGGGGSSGGGSDDDSGGDDVGAEFGFGHEHHHNHHRDVDTGGGESDIGYEPPTYGAGATGDPADLDGMSVGLIDPYGATGTSFGFGEEVMGGGADGDGDDDGGEPIFGTQFGADFGGEGPAFGDDLGTELGAEFGFGADEEENLEATPEEILGDDFEEAYNPPGAWDPSTQAPTLRNPVLEFGGEMYSGFGVAPIIGCEHGPYGVKG